MLPKVFCIGLSRTGTTTFQQVMNQLGIVTRSGPARLGLELLELGRFDDIFTIIDKYDGLCDMPYPFMYERLCDRYPGSFFVLTTRRSEDQWLESLRNLGLRHGPTETFGIAYGCYEVDSNEERLRELYRNHNEAVRTFFRGSCRFVEVCWELGDGLSSIGKLLGVDVSGVTVPAANSTAEKNARRTVEQLCRKDRVGAAVRYARHMGGADELLEPINRHVDRRLRKFLRSIAVKRALRRLKPRR